MNIIFMRHGQASDNVNEILSDREIYWSTLTDEGIETVKNTVDDIKVSIDKIYTSPFPRTLETAHYVHDKFPNVQVNIDNRLHEIYYGKYSGCRNNEELDNIREKQIGGDYFVRFGEYGENKYQIEERLCNFLKELYENNLKTNTIMIISHGSITSYMKRLLKLKSPHIKTGKAEMFEDVDFAPMFKYLKKMKTIKNKLIKNNLETVKGLNVNKKLKSNLNKIIKDEFNNIEFDNNSFDNYLTGLKVNCLEKINSAVFDDGVILISFYNNIENFAKKWIEHYIKIGVKNFVLVNNNSIDNSEDILKEYLDKVNIEFWNVKEEYNCYKMCGWKQSLLEHYGANKYYLTVDSDELFVYENYESININDFIKKSKAIKAIMLDVYSDKKIYEGTLDDYKFVDKDTYKIDENVPYGQRVFGGPRTRMFNIKPSLQKVPLIYYTGMEAYVNDHYYYPWDINKNCLLKSYLLHYKFLPGDYEKYVQYVNDKRHWNESREYKKYIEDKNCAFYDKDHSIRIDDIKYNF